MAYENRIAGVITVTVDGKTIMARGGWEVNVGPVGREGVVGQDGVQGYLERARIPVIKGTITDHPSLDLEWLGGIENATISIELANKKGYVLRNAWEASDGIPLKTETGEIEVEFQGMSCEKL